MEKFEVGEIFTISDDDGVEQEVELIAAIQMEGNDYVAVSFVEDLNDEAEEIDVFFLKVDAEGDFDAIESDEEFDKVSKAFDELIDEEE